MLYFVGLLYSSKSPKLTFQTLLKLVHFDSHYVFWYYRACECVEFSYFKFNLNLNCHSKPANQVLILAGTVHHSSKITSFYPSAPNAFVSLLQ